MSQKFAKWLLLIALLAYATLMAAWANLQVQSRACKGLKVEVVSEQGTPSFLTPKAVERELGDLPLRAKGTPLSAINTAALEQRLAKVNNFEDVDCIITSDGYLLVRVTPIVPEARIFTPAGTYYINKQGKRLDAHAEYYVNLPVVRGNFTDKMPASGALPVVRKLLNDSLLRNLVTMIDYRSPTNIILIPRIRGHVINIGDTLNLNEKIANLSLFYRKIMPHKGWGVYDTISVKYRGQVVATRADKSRAVHSPTFADEDPDPEEQTAINQTEPLDLSTEPVEAPAPAKQNPSQEKSSQAKDSQAKSSEKKSQEKNNSAKKSSEKKNSEKSTRQ